MKYFVYLDTNNPIAIATINYLISELNFIDNIYFISYKVNKKSVRFLIETNENKQTIFLLVRSLLNQLSKIINKEIKNKISIKEKR